MLTIKQIVSTGESLWLGTDVNYASDSKTVSFSAEGKTRTLKEGAVYVMTPSGATVGRYFLANAPEPVASFPR